MFFVAGALSLAAVGGGVSYAADGGAVLIGRSNRASVTTSLSNPGGTALSLISKPGTPPLRVNDASKIVHLNADLVDGVDSSAFARTAGRTGIVFGAVTDDDGFVNTAHCPAGTIATGGGGYAVDPYYSGPDLNADRTIIPNSWFVVGRADAYAWVVCYNPRGAVVGAATRVPSAIRSAVAQKHMP
jgi:hypothetical protein